MPDYTLLNTTDVQILKGDKHILWADDDATVDRPAVKAMVSAANHPLPPGELLLLTVDRDVERDCEHHPQQNMAPPGCPRCGQYWDAHSQRLVGAGRVTRRLRGWVELYVRVIQKDFAVLKLMHRGEAIIEIAGSPNRASGNPMHWSPVHQAEGPFRDAVVAAWKDGTLPPEIAANLTETDNKQEDDTDE